MKFRVWIEQLWLDNCDERYQCREPRFTRSEYFQRFKYFLKHEYRRQQRLEKI